MGKINQSIGPNVELFSYLHTEFKMLQETWDELVHGTFIVQTLSLEYRVIMKFREWMLSKGYVSMGTVVKIKIRLLYHGQNDDQAKVVPLYHGHSVDRGPRKGYCTMGTLLRDKHLCELGPKGLKPNNYFVLYWGWVKVSVPWAYCWDPRKCHHTMGTTLRAKQRSLSHVYNIEGQGRVTRGTVLMS